MRKALLIMAGVVVAGTVIRATVLRDNVARPATSAPTSAVPAKLVGQWTRKVTNADVKRTGYLQSEPDPSARSRIKKSGGAGIDCNPNAGQLLRARSSGGRESSPHQSWHPFAKRLQVACLRATAHLHDGVKDTVADREAAMEGVGKWK